MDKASRLTPENITFVFIDLQKKLLDKIEGQERLIAAARPPQADCPLLKH